MVPVHRSKTLTKTEREGGGGRRGTKGWKKEKEGMKGEREEGRDRGEKAGMEGGGRRGTGLCSSVVWTHSASS